MLRDRLSWCSAILATGPASARIDLPVVDGLLTGTERLALVRGNSPDIIEMAACCCYLLVERILHLTGSLGIVDRTVFEHPAVRDHLVDDPVLLCGLSIHNEVVLRVGADALGILAGVVRSD